MSQDEYLFDEFYEVHPTNPGRGSMSLVMEAAELIESHIVPVIQGPKQAKKTDVICSILGRPDMKVRTCEPIRAAMLVLIERGVPVCGCSRGYFFARDRYEAAIGEQWLTKKMSGLQRRLDGLRRCFRKDAG